MSIANLLVQQVYTTDGITTSFPIPYAFLPGDAEDVTKVYSVDTATGIKTLKTIGALNDYTLPHDTDTEPANVVFNTAPTTGDVLVTRVLSFTQAIEFINSGRLLLDNIEEGMDILTMLIQQVNQMATKSVRLHEINTIAQFDPTYPPDISAAADKVPIINSTSSGWAAITEWPTADDIANAQEYAEAASDSASTAANSASAAAVSAAAAALSAVAAAASGDPASQFSITDGQAASDLSRELYDGVLYRSIALFFSVVRGTTVFANGVVYMQYLNGTWRVAAGESVGEAHGLTFSVSQATTFGQLRLAADIGAGNGTIRFKKKYFTV